MQRISDRSLELSIYYRVSIISLVVVSLRMQELMLDYMLGWRLGRGIEWNFGMIVGVGINLFK